MKRALATSLAWFALAGIALLAGALVTQTPGTTASDAMAKAAFYSSTALALLTCAAAVWIRRPLTEVLGLSRPAPTAGLLWIVLVLGMLGWSHLADLTLELLRVREGSILTTVERELHGVSLRQLANALIGLALAPAIAEELLFRGLLLRQLRRRIGAVAALLLSSVLFGALHLEAPQGGAAIVVGLYLGVVALATGSTWAAIVCHLVNNAVAVVLGVVGGTPASMSKLVFALSLAMALGGAVTLVVLLRRATDRQSD